MQNPSRRQRVWTGAILNRNGGNAVAILGKQLVGALLNLAAGEFIAFTLSLFHDSGCNIGITLIDQTANSLTPAGKSLQ